MTFRVEIEQEEDGRWIAEVIGLPGALSYGSSQEQAIANAKALAAGILLERGEQEDT